MTLRGVSRTRASNAPSSSSTVSSPGQVPKNAATPDTASWATDAATGTLVPSPSFSTISELEAEIVSRLPDTRTGLGAGVSSRSSCILGTSSEVMIRGVLRPRIPSSRTPSKPPPDTRANRTQASSNARSASTSSGSCSTTDARTVRRDRRTSGPRSRPRPRETASAGAGRRTSSGPPRAGLGLRRTRGRARGQAGDRQRARSIEPCRTGSLADALTFHGEPGRESSPLQKRFHALQQNRCRNP